MYELRIFVICKYSPALNRRSESDVWFMGKSVNHFTFHKKRPRTSARGSCSVQSVYDDVQDEQDQPKSTGRPKHHPILAIPFLVYLSHCHTLRKYWIKAIKMMAITSRTITAGRTTIKIRFARPLFLYSATKCLAFDTTTSLHLHPV